MENAPARMVRSKDTVRYSIRRTLRSGVTVQPAPHTRFLTLPAHHLPEQDRSRDRNRPLHRRLLQSRPPPFGARLHQPTSVRRAGSVKSKTLSTNAGQVQYERHGVANLFMMFAPLEGWRHVKVTDRHTAIDYAHVLRD